MRTAIYVDGGLFTEAVRGQGMSMNMDLMSLVEHLASGTKVVAVHFVVPEFPKHPYPNKNRNQKRQMEEYAAQGISIVYCQPQVIGSIFVDRGIEATITSKAIVDAFADAFDRALFISCRAELIPAIEAIRGIGKDVEVAYFTFADAPVNQLGAVANRQKTISIDEIVSRRKAGPAPYEMGSPTSLSGQAPRLDHNG
ncbi:MAG: NYN domain-containing protein [Mesorhizobium sp.]|nr:MAG: NYN domain-containing protein [Mesorhizobium sp.]